MESWRHMSRLVVQRSAAPGKLPVQCHSWDIISFTWKRFHWLFLTSKLEVNQSNTRLILTIIHASSFCLLLSFHKKKEKGPRYIYCCLLTPPEVQDISDLMSTLIICRTFPYYCAFRWHHYRNEKGINRVLMKYFVYLNVQDALEQSGSWRGLAEGNSKRRRK